MMVDNTSQAGISDWLKQLLGHLKGKFSGPTSAEKYIKTHKPKDADERVWLLKEIKRLRENPGFQENPIYKVLRDYAMTEYGEYGQGEEKQPKEKPY